MTGVRLDPGEYAALWRGLGGVERPALLHTLDHGATLSERDALDAAAWERLAARGCAQGRRPVAWLADLLGVLAAPDAELDLCFWAGGTSRPVRHGLVAAARGAHGVVAGLDGTGGLWAETVDGHDLPAGLLARAPAGSPLPGVAMTVPVAAVAGTADDERERRLRRAGVPRPTMQRLHALWSTPPRRVLQFGVARRGADGRRRRGERPLDVVDADPGRVALVPDPTGRYLTLRPAPLPWLRRELTDRLAAL